MTCLTPCRTPCLTPVSPCRTPCVVVPPKPPGRCDTPAHPGGAWVLRTAGRDARSLTLSAPFSFCAARATSKTFADRCGSAATSYCWMVWQHGCEPRAPFGSVKIIDKIIERAAGPVSLQPPTNGGSSQAKTAMRAAKRFTILASGQKSGCAVRTNVRTPYHRRHQNAQ